MPEMYPSTLLLFSKASAQKIGSSWALVKIPAMMKFCFAFFLILNLTQDVETCMLIDKTEKEIIEGIAAQSDRVLLYCYKKYAPLVKSWIIKNGGNETQAEDVFQEGIIALYTNIRLGKFESGRAKVSTYLMQICKFKWYDIKKSSHSTKVSLLDDFQPLTEGLIDFENDLERLDDQKKVHKAMANLKERCQKILTLFYWERKTMEEIASSLSMQINSVKNGKYRCMQSLKDQFKSISHGA